MCIFTSPKKTHDSFFLIFSSKSTVKATLFLQLWMLLLGRFAEKKQAWPILLVCTVHVFKKIQNKPPPPSPEFSLVGSSTMTLLSPSLHMRNFIFQLHPTIPPKRYYSSSTMTSLSIMPTSESFSLTVIQQSHKKIASFPHYKRTWFFSRKKVAAHHICVI